MKIASLVVTVATSTCCLGCVPVNPSPADVVGDWEVTWSCGTESLKLNATGTFSHSVKLAGGGQVSDSGVWVIKPKSEKLGGANLILQNALDFCSALGEKLDHPERHDISLDTVWEWGRTVLSFNPDAPGYTRR